MTVEVIDDKMVSDSSQISISYGQRLLIKVRVINPRTIPMQYRAELYLISPDGKKVLVDKKTGTLGGNRRPLLSGISVLGGFRAFGSHETEVVFESIDTGKYEPGDYKFKVEVHNAMPLGMNIISPQIIQENSYNVAIKPVVELERKELQASQIDEKKVKQ